MDAMEGAEVGLFAKAVAAYLLGGIMGGDVMRQLFGGDSLRDRGSGNVGASNALRTRGWRFALGVLAVDIGKGVLAVLLLAGLNLPVASHVQLYAAAAPFVCGFAAVVGHCYPAFAGFRGGRGVATAAGVTIAALPAVTPWMVAVFAIMILMTGYASLASLIGALAVTIWVACAYPAGILSAAGLFAIGICGLLMFKHRENLARLVAGTESRFERLRFMGRLFDRMAGAWRVG